MSNLVDAGVEMQRQTKYRHTNPNLGTALTVARMGKLPHAALTFANPILVAEKKPLEEKQRQWESKRSVNLPLNG